MVRITTALVVLLATSCSSSSSSVSTDAGSGGVLGAGGTTGTGGVSATGGSTGSGGIVGSGGSSGTSGASMADVQAIFDARCVTCHDASKAGLPAFPGLPLTDGASHASLVNQAASETCGGTLVVPGSPAQSYLIQKLTNSTPCSGSRMPRPFEVGPMVPLTSQQIATITAWISAGAPP